jgi:hypothetical protein
MAQPQRNTGATLNTSWKQFPQTIVFNEWQTPCKPAVQLEARARNSKTLISAKKQLLVAQCFRHSSNHCQLETKLQKRVSHNAGCLQ